MGRIFGLAVVASVCLYAQAPLSVTTPRQAFGFNIGDDYSVVNYSQMESYWKQLDAESDRMLLADIGPTAEGRRQWMAIVSAPENLARLDLYRSIAERLAHAESLTPAEAEALARTGKAIVWIDGGLHANETVGSQQLIEMVYQMVSRTDEETQRLLADTIQLYVPANPDGQELVANWYMREPDPSKRSLTGLPKLYQKYVGHDNNRDFFLSAMPETTNMNRQMFVEWFPQIVYNHHQAGPAGTVVFIPPFRDPFNYNLDPLVPLGIDAVGAAMQTRLLQEGKGGSVTRDGATYSTWWNGGLRTVSYFHNMIGLLTEIIGDPAPIEIPLVPERQLPRGALPMPVAPGKWRYRQSVDYEITQNRAVLDYASRYRETLLMNIYRMGRNSIEKGSRDSWTVAPKRIAALRAQAPPNGRVPAELYASVLRDPKYRDPRGYIVPSSQPDFPTAVKFINSLLKTGVSVLRATSEFRVNGKRYPAGSFIIKTAQAFRPHVLDMFEPQDHPDDFRYPGGPPIPPYDITGWTLALQMGVQFDRILDAFEGPFERVTGLATPRPELVSGSATPNAYCIGHETNDAFIVVNRLLKARREVTWNQQDGSLCTNADERAREIVTAASAELGVPARGLERPASGSARRLKLPRIALLDGYGGLPSSGWTRWLLEQYEFPFEVVYPAALDAGDLRQKFDIVLITDESYPRGNGGQPRPEAIPEEYRSWLGRITPEKTVPALKSFVEAGGALITIGGATGLAPLLGLPVTDHLVAERPEGGTRTLTREEMYVPGSLLRVNVDSSHPLAHGMGSDAVVFFDDSPVFRLGSTSARPIAWYGSAEPLVSGWAWGQQHLAGGVAVADVPLGEGRMILYGPEVVFRAQPHGTFKLLFNGILYGASESVTLP